jgi:hypothetical protein
MPDLGEFLPVIGYPLGWLLLGVGLLVVIAAWYVAVILGTRKRVPVPQRPLEPQLSYGERVAKLKADYLHRVTSIGGRAERGEISTRRAHSELSESVREFATLASGIQATYMTLTDLKQTNLSAVTAAVEDFYPSAFSADGRGDAALGVQAAQKVIDEWN